MKYFVKPIVAILLLLSTIAGLDPVVRTSALAFFACGIIAGTMVNDAFVRRRQATKEAK